MILSTGSVPGACIAALVAASAVQAFSGTYPLVAWTSHHQYSHGHGHGKSLQSTLSLLDPSHPSHSKSVFRPTPQQPFESMTGSEESAEEDDLCALETVLLVSVPGLHYSDFSLLPKGGIVSGSKSVIRKALSSNKNSVVYPYNTIHNHQTAAKNTAIKLANEFLKCGASLAHDGEFQSEDNQKTIRFYEVNGLQEWETTGRNAREARTELMKGLDATLQTSLRDLAEPYLIVITALPSDPSQHLSSTRKHLSKRQIMVDGPVEIETGSSAAAESPDSASAYDRLSNLESELKAELKAEEVEILEYLGMGVDGKLGGLLAKNDTMRSIFTVDPNSGLLHRYVFFTPPLIFGLLISLLILIPVIVMAAHALTAIETVAGLEGKMTGTVGLDPSKA